MLEDVPGLINPIIQAMIATSRQQGESADRVQRAQQLKQQADYQRAESAHAQAQTDEIIRSHKAEEDLRNRHYEEVEKPMQDAMVAKYNLENLAQKLHLGNAGVKFPVNGQQGQPQLPPPEEYNRLLAEQQSSEAQAKSFGSNQGQIQSQLTPEAQVMRDLLTKGEISAEDRKTANAKDLAKFNQDFENQRQNKQIASQQMMDQLNKGTQLQIAAMNRASAEKIAGMHFQPSDDSLQALQIGMATGQYKPNMTNPQERAAYGTLVQNGFRLPDPKDIDALKQGQTMAPLFDKLNDFADKYLPSEAKEGNLAKLHALIQGKIASTAFPSDVQNQVNEIKSQAMNVGKTIEGLTGGRVTNTQLGLALDAITSPGITREQAQSRLQNLKDLYINKQENVIMGGMPSAQQDLIRKTYGLQPSWLLNAPKQVQIPGKPGQMAPLDLQESNKQGKPAYALPQVPQ